MSLENPDIDSACVSLDQAIQADLEGQLDVEGSSPADELITMLQQGGDGRDSFEQAVISLAALTDKRPNGWWTVFERIVVLANLSSATLGDNVEIILQSVEIDDPRDRASIYSLLDVCGRPQTAQILNKDRRLREGAPLLWLDLMLLRVPTLSEGQSLVLAAISENHFGVEQFTQRLDEIRTFGGSKLGSWLREIRSKLPLTDIDAYDKIVNKAFGSFDLKEQESDNAALDVSTNEAVGQSFIEVLTRVFTKALHATLEHPVEEIFKPTRLRQRHSRRNRTPPPRPSHVGELSDALNIPRIQQTKHLASAEA